MKIVWKLQLTKRIKHGHVCCGIGIIQQQDFSKIMDSKLGIISANKPYILNARKTEYKSLIGFQCGTYNELQLKPYWSEHPMWTDLHYEKVWGSNGHVVCGTHTCIDAIKKEELTSYKCCFMRSDIIKLVLDLEAMKLNIYINHNLSAPKYSTSIENIEEGSYCLGVWLMNYRDSITIL